MKTLLLGLALISSVTYAKEGGNGGGAHYCPSRSFQEVYDIYEGYNRYNIAPTNKKLSMREHINRAIKRIKHTDYRSGLQVEEAVNYLFNGHFLVRPNIRLVLIPDANILITDEGCTYKQLANWDDVSGNVIVDGKLYSQLDELNKAALYIHEAVYKVARDSYGDENSDRVRKIVAYALSEVSHKDFKAFSTNIIKFTEEQEPESFNFKKRPQMTWSDLARYDFNSLFPEDVKGFYDLNYHHGDEDLSGKSFKINVSMSSTYFAKAINGLTELIAKYETAVKENSELLADLRERVKTVPLTKYEQEFERIQKYNFYDTIKKYRSLLKKAEKLKNADELAGKPTERQRMKKEIEDLPGSISNKVNAIEELKKDMAKLKKTAEDMKTAASVITKEIASGASYNNGYFKLKLPQGSLSATTMLRRELKIEFTPEDYQVVLSIEGNDEGKKAFETQVVHTLAGEYSKHYVLINLNLSQNLLR